MPKAAIDTKTYECRRCRIDRPINEFDKHVKCENGRRKICKHCRNEDRRARYYKPENQEKFKSQRRESRLKKRYGISIEQYDEMFSHQNGLCAICGEKCPRNNRLSVDHDHESGKVRGLLCDPCNRLLACARDSADRLRSAISYLGAY